MKTRWIMMMAGLVALCGTAQASDWVTIGNAGNAAQSASNRGHEANGGDGRGAVSYTYQISKYAVSIADWSTFYNDGDSGKVGIFNSAYNYWNDGTRNVGTAAPAIRISFHQAAQYANWLTTDSATSGAYTIDESGAVTAIDRDFRNASGMLYVLPTENEWFKAAYYDGANEKYTLYAHGADTAPPKSADGSTDWNYDDALNPSQPWTVGMGTEEQNGTFNMMGNVFEWTETFTVISQTDYAIRLGGRYSSPESFIRSSNQSQSLPTDDAMILTGIRIVAIPEPMSAGLLVITALSALGVWRIRRMKRGYKA